jgi:hypothetical protein
LDSCDPREGLEKGSCKLRISPRVSRKATNFFISSATVNAQKTLSPMELQATSSARALFILPVGFSGLFVFVR